MSKGFSVAYKDENVVKSVHELKKGDVVHMTFQDGFAEAKIIENTCAKGRESEMTKPTFATAMTELEEVVRKLEQGDVPLEEAIDLYKKGMELSKLCHDTLQNAEQQLISIVGEDGEKTTVPTRKWRIRHGNDIKAIY